MGEKAYRPTHLSPNQRIKKEKSKEKSKEKQMVVMTLPKGGG